jgi:uncharacterized protein (DUF433 family)
MDIEDLEMKSDLISVNKNVQGGVPCFKGTRVPVASLYDHLEQGSTLDEFLEDFPTVMREQAIGVLELAKADVPRFAEPASR